MATHDPILDVIGDDVAAELEHVAHSADDPGSAEPVLEPYETLLRSLRAAVEVEIAAEDPVGDAAE